MNSFGRIEGWIGLAMVTIMLVANRKFAEGINRFYGFKGVARLKNTRRIVVVICILGLVFSLFLLLG